MHASTGTFCICSSFVFFLWKVATIHNKCSAESNFYSKKNKKKFKKIKIQKKTYLILKLH